MTSENISRADIVLIGAGIMSATLGMLLKQLDPSVSIEIFEKLDSAAAESSDSWNNAGTGHSAFCELNYTPEKPDGTIDISKAIKIAESFEVSKQFWSYLTANNIIDLPSSFITSIPHMSFVWGEKNVQFLRKRYNALQTCNLFKEMQYSDDPQQIKKWMPLVMNERNSTDAVAATKMELGADVNFGTLTRNIFDKLKQMDNVNIHFNYSVIDLVKKHSNWNIELKDEKTNLKRTVHAKFVFIGAGGGSLPLLLKTGIPESKGFGGFPISGQWLRCTNEKIIEQHNAKVYGLASVGAPPMSVPHLDTRWIKDKKELLFGPYAGFTTKFLKSGSLLDLFRSIKFSNIRAMVFAGMHNLPLTKYLIEQVSLTPAARLHALQEYYPGAKKEDWESIVAGYRVQVIKKDEGEGGILEFGTEVVSASDGSIAALLGASPGASTAVSIMIDLLNRCFEDKMTAWEPKFKQMIPSYGRSLNSDDHLVKQVREYTSRELGLKYPH